MSLHSRQESEQQQLLCRGLLGVWHDRGIAPVLELKLELIQPQVAQKPAPRGEVSAKRRHGRAPTNFSLDGWEDERKREDYRGHF